MARRNWKNMEPRPPWRRHGTLYDLGPGLEGQEGMQREGIGMRALVAGNRQRWNGQMPGFSVKNGTWLAYELKGPTPTVKARDSQPSLHKSHLRGAEIPWPRLHSKPLNSDSGSEVSRNSLENCKSLED